MGEGEEIIEIGELRRHVDSRHVELVGYGRNCSFQGGIGNWAGGIGRLLLMLMLLVLSESCGAGYDVQQPSHVRNGLLLCGVLLCTGRQSTHPYSSCFPIYRRLPIKLGFFLRIQ